jgi:hypothetical protein
MFQVEQSLSDKINAVVKKTWHEFTDFSEKIIDEGWSWLKKKFSSTSVGDDEESKEHQVRRSYVRAKTIVE